MPMLVMGRCREGNEGNGAFARNGGEAKHRSDEAKAFPAQPDEQRTSCPKAVAQIARCRTAVFEPDVTRYAEEMGKPRNIVILTGAGVSAESGVATFRGPVGLWEGQRVEDVCKGRGER